MRIAYLTAGAAGMYCGSCLQDNALAKALIKLGHDTLLIPTYTPIKTDEENVSTDRLFYGGLNVYLQQLSPVFRWLPTWADSFLSSPRLVGWIASRSMGTSASKLGGLTVSMLKGTNGRQKKEVLRLCTWLSSQEPEVVIFSNLLIAGCLPEIKKRMDCPVVVILQGDDIFYNSLEAPYRERAIEELRRLAQDVDLFIVHSQDYGQRMQRMLGFSSERLAVVPLSIDVSDFVELEIPQTVDRPPTIGYLARIAPEKGLHELVDAFIDVQKSIPEARLEIAGWLGPQDQDYWQLQRNKIDAAGLAEQFKYHGSVDRKGKMDFLQSIDLLCVPTSNAEPKGLFVLEALAAGVPYVLPSHGAFPELHERLQGGFLVAPNSPQELAQQLIDSLQNLEICRRLGQQGRQNVLDSASTEHAAQRFAELLSRL